MTTLDKATRPEAGGQPPTPRPAHDPTVPFYAVGGADPDFALPPRRDARHPGIWARIFTPGRRS